MLAAKRRAVRLRVLQRGPDQLQVFRVDLPVDHSGIERGSRCVAEDYVQALVPDGSSVTQIVIESTELCTFEGEAQPLLAATDRHVRTVSDLDWGLEIPQLGMLSTWSRPAPLLLAGPAGSDDPAVT